MHINIRFSEEIQKIHQTQSSVGYYSQVPLPPKRNLSWIF